MSVLYDEQVAAGSTFLFHLSSRSRIKLVSGFQSTSAVVFGLLHRRTAAFLRHQFPSTTKLAERRSALEYPVEQVLVRRDDKTGEAQR